jgi:hypothetical protein
MHPGKSRSLSFSFSCAVATLFFFLGLTTATLVQAQSKPPILSDKDISAYNKQQILALQTTAADVAHADAAKLARNKLIAIGVEQIDTSFNDFRKKSRKRTDTLSFLFDFLEIGASSAISIVGGARSKSLIGEGLSLFQGSRSAFNKDFRFLERQILFDKMVAKRSQKLTAIYGKLNDTVVKYPWEQSRSELRDYFFAGTIDEALSSLSRDTGREAANSEEDLQSAKRAAGIVGAVPPAVLQASSDNSKLIEMLTLPKAQAVFTSVQAEPQLLEILPTLSTRQEIQAPFGAILEGSLTRIRANSGTIDDYRRILLHLNDVVTEMIPTDPRPNDRLASILKANK